MLKLSFRLRYDSSVFPLLAPTQPHHSSKMNPVIADVVSLANGSATQPSASADTTLTGKFIHTAQVQYTQVDVFSHSLVFEPLVLVKVPYNLLM